MGSEPARAAAQFLDLSGYISILADSYSLLTNQKEKYLRRKLLCEFVNNSDIELLIIVRM